MQKVQHNPGERGRDAPHSADEAVFGHLLHHFTINFARAVLVNLTLGFRYSTSLLAVSANRLARRPPPAKTTDGRREAAPRCFVDEGSVLLKQLR